MKTIATPSAATESINVAVESGSTIELIAVMTAMVFVACLAASLLLTTPRALQSVAHAAPVQPATAAVSVERPFHERYPVNASAESIDAPTF